MADLLVRMGGRIRGQSTRSLNLDDVPLDLDLNPRGDLIAVQSMPERAEVVRMGNSYGAQIPTGSAFAPVAAWPTTRAEIVLFNNEAIGGKVYVIDRVWMAVIGSMTAAQNFGMLGQLVPNSPGGVAIPANNTAVLRQSLSGNRTAGVANNSKSLIAIANTAFCVANQWFALGTQWAATATPNVGAAVEAFCYGKYLVPPGAVFGLAGIAAAATGTAIIGIEWHEVQLPQIAN